MTTAADKPISTHHENPFLPSFLFYIASIFVLAGSPVAETLSELNPYSLLHIPLYGIMTFLLVFSIVPIPRGFKVGSIRLGGDSTRPRSADTTGRMLRFFVSGAIALAVGILDEVHQLSVPGRDASAGDVILDLVGIVIALLFCFWFFKTRFLNKSTQPAQTR